MLQFALFYMTCAFAFVFGCKFQLSKTPTHLNCIYLLQTHCAQWAEEVYLFTPNMSTLNNYIPILLQDFSTISHVMD